MITFGPVQSRRLGRCLGIDIVPRKICTLDCVYCEVGRTTEHTARRREYVPVAEVLAEVRGRIQNGLDVDYLTITGSGEPTLSTGLGRIIDGLRQITALPIAVLTNGTLLGEVQVQRDLKDADLVLPSLDAGTQEEYERINRPAAGLTLHGLVAGMEKFRGAYEGMIWLEVLLVGGVTDTEQSVKRIAALARRIRPDRVQLNTVARPPAESWVTAVPVEQVERLAGLFTPVAEVIVSVPHAAAHNTTSISVARSDIMALLKRRPCPAAEICAGLGVAPKQLEESLAILMEAGLVQSQTREGVTYYFARPGEEEI